MSTKYQVLGPLGRGGMGLVFRARQLELERVVALKIVLPDAGDELEPARRFRREIDACCALSHPNIIKILDCGEMEDGKLFFTMELLDARDLADVRQQGPLPPELAIDYMTQGADALAYIHERRMVHRDIKPANMMVDARGRLTIMDFGLVKIAGRTVFTQDGQTVGTLRYVAPELLAEEGSSPAQDVYSLALSFWELVANRHAVESSDFRELAAAILSRPVPPLASVVPATPPWFSDLLSRCLSKKPSDRPTAAQIVEQLREGTARHSRAAAPEPARDGAPPRSGRSGRPSRRISGVAAPVNVVPAARPVRWWLVGAAVASIGLAAGLGSVLFRSRPPAPSSPGARTGPPPPQGLVWSPRVTFPEDRLVHIAVPPGTPSGPASLKAHVDGGQARTLMASVTGGVVEVGSLPAGAAVTLTGPADPGWAFLPLRFRTPAHAVLRNLTVLPADQAVLVDLDNPVRVPLLAEIGKWGERAPMRSITSPPGRPSFRWEVGGLVPDTAYFLRVRVIEGWGGIEDFRFRTLPPARARELQMALANLAGEPAEIHDLTLDTLERFPDLRALGRLVALLRDHSPADYRSGLEWQLRVKAARVLQLTRMPGIGDALYPVFAREPKDFVQRHFVAALAAARDRRALDLAAQMLPEQLRRSPDSLIPRLERLAEELSVLAGPDTVRFLDGLRQDLAHPAWNQLPHAMVRADRGLAASILLGLLRNAPSPARQEDWLGISGAQQLGDDAALAALSPRLDRRHGGALRDAAIQAVASIDDPAAAALLVQALKREPAHPALLLAAAQRGLEETLGLALAAVAPDRPVPIRMAAVLALGLVADGPAAGKRQISDPEAGPLGPASDPRQAGAVVKALIPFLSDRERGVRDTACWALGRWKQPEAIAAVRSLALSPDDTLGRAALALAELQDRDAAPFLSRLLDSSSRDPEVLHRQALVAVALGRLGHFGSRPALEALASRTGRDNALLSFAGREALKELDGFKGQTDPIKKARTRTIWIDGMSPVVRTGIRLVPGESVELAGTGFWGWGAAAAAQNRVDAMLPPQPGRPPLRLLIRIGRRLLVLPSRPVRYLVEDPCEVVLFCLNDPHATPPGHDPVFLPSRGVGLVRVTIDL